MLTRFSTRPTCCVKPMPMACPWAERSTRARKHQTFLVWAMRDPLSVPLAKVQVVKVWYDSGPKETIYDVACSDGITPDPETRRCDDNGATVDMSNCMPSTGQGAPELKALWRDPDFDAGQSAIYYVRVIENPTCRWSTWDAMRNGTPPHPDLPQTIRERAYTSPIWYDAS